MAVFLTNLHQRLLYRASHKLIHSKFLKSSNSTRTVLGFRCIWSLDHQLFLINSKTLSGEREFFQIYGLMNSGAIFSILTQTSSISTLSSALIKFLITLLRAADTGHLICMELLVKVGADVNKPRNSEDGETALMKTAKEGYAQCVKLLMKSGADVNLATKNKNCNPNFTALVKATESGKTECLKVLLEAGATVNTKNISGRTALYSVTESVKIPCVKMLIKSGAYVNIRRNDGTTPLICATISTSKPCLEAPLEADANANAYDRDGNTALKQ